MTCPVCDDDGGHAWNCPLMAPTTRDSDGSPKGGDGEAGSVHDSAGRNGIAAAIRALNPTKDAQS